MHRRAAETFRAGLAPAQQSALLAGKAQAPSIWAFVVADAASFGIFFAVFSSERSEHASLFAQSAARLDIALGLFNTLVLITSSWLVAHSLTAARAGNNARARRNLTFALAVASLFTLCKGYEYAGKIQHGITPMTNEFFSFYFALTGVHFLHYVIGFGALVYILRTVLRGDHTDSRQLTWLQSGALYWHLVDLLWIFLFPLLYLQRGL